LPKVVNEKKCQMFLYPVLEKFDESKSEQSTGFHENSQI
jgi:hypothetical protein